MARVAIYLRVSTRDQSVDSQRLALTEWAAVRRHTIVAEFVDDGISGAKGRDKRPGLDALLRAATTGKFNMVAAVDLSRFGRSLIHLVSIAEELRILNVDLYVGGDFAMDTTTPAGQLMFNVFGAIAEYTRQLIREKTRQGIAAARKRGKRIGRPRVSDGRAQRVEALLKAGTSISKTHRLTRVGIATIYRIKGEVEQAAQEEAAWRAAN